MKPVERRIAGTILALVLVTHAAKADSLAPGMADRLKACMPELTAYLRVTMLARQFGDDADVLDDALEGLRDQLSECLADAAGPAALTVAGRK